MTTRWADLPPDLVGVLADALAGCPADVAAMRLVCRDWRAAASARLAALAPSNPLPSGPALHAAFPALRSLDLTRARPAGAEGVAELLACLPGLEAVKIALPSGASPFEERVERAPLPTGRAPAAAAAPPLLPPAVQPPPSPRAAGAPAGAPAGAVLPPPRSLARIATRPREPTSPPPPPADDVAAAVGRAAPAARRLDFSASPALTDAGLARLASLPLPRLDALRLDGCTALTDAGLAAAAAGLGARLTRLSLASAVSAAAASPAAAAAAATTAARAHPHRAAWPATKLSDAGCLALASNAPRLAVLDLRGHSGITPAGVAALAAACPLASLALAGGPAATDAGVAAAALAGATLRHLRVEAAGRAWRSPGGHMDAADLLAAAFAALPPTPQTGSGGGSPLARAAALAAAAAAATSSSSPASRASTLSPHFGRDVASGAVNSAAPSTVALTGTALALVAARLPRLTSLALVGAEWAAGERVVAGVAAADGASPRLLPHLTSLDFSGPPRSALAARPADDDGGGGGGDHPATPRTSPPLDALDLRALAHLDVSGSGLAGGAAAAVGARATRLVTFRAARCHGLKPPHLAAVLAGAGPARLALVDVRGCEGLARAGRRGWARLAGCARLTTLALGPAIIPAGPAWFAGGGDPWAAGGGADSDGSSGAGSWTGSDRGRGGSASTTPDGGDRSAEAALAAACALPRLAHLTLAGVPLTPAAGAHIAAMPALVSLTAAGCPAATGAACPPGPAGALADGFRGRAASGGPPPTLSRLDLAHTDAGGPELADLLAVLGPCLTALDLTGCPWGDDPADVAALRGTPRLSALAAGGPVPPGAGDGLSDASLAALPAAAPSLAALTIASPGAGLTPRGLRRGLAGLPKLTALNLPGGEGLADPAAVLAALTPTIAPRLASLGLADPGGAAARAVGPPGRAARLAEGELAAFLAAAPRLARLDLRGVTITPGAGRPPAARAAAAAAAAAGNALLAAALDAAGLAALAVDTVAGAAAAGVGRLVAVGRR